MEVRIGVALEGGASPELDRAKHAARALGAEVGGRMSRFRFDYPERELWTVWLNNGDGTFDLVKPGHGTMERVPAMDPRARKFLQPGMTVVVIFVNCDRNRPLIRGFSLARQPLPVVGFQVLHAFDRVNHLQTNHVPDAGSPPTSLTLDATWQSDVIGDARDEFPLTLVTAYLDGEAHGWIGSAIGANGGNFSGGNVKRITCFNLTTGETRWQFDISITSPANANSCKLLLDEYQEELLITEMNPRSFGGTDRWQRVNARTGALIGGLSGGLGGIYLTPRIIGRGNHLMGPGSNLDHFRTAGRVDENAYALADGWTGDTIPALGPSPIYAEGTALVPYFPEVGELCLRSVFQQWVDGFTRRGGLVVGFDATTGDQKWTYNYYTELGYTESQSVIVDAYIPGDSDGNSYMNVSTTSVGTPAATLVSLDKNGAERWSVAITPTSQEYSLFGLWNNALMVQKKANATSTFHPMRLSLADGSVVSQMPTLGWSLNGTVWGDQWAYPVFEATGAGTIKIRAVDESFNTLVEVTDTAGIAPFALAYPKSPLPVTLFNGYVYAPKWDASESRWRIKRWR